MTLILCPKCTHPMKRVWTDKYIITVCTNNKCMHSYKRAKPKEKKC